MGATATTIPIERWGADRLAERLVYYDLSGRKFESAPPGTVLEEALKLFSGAPKAVPRSSGGLVTAEPYQLVVYGDPSIPSSAPPSLRVRVKFRDFRRDPHGRVRSAEYVTHKKTVTIEDLREPFSFRASTLGHQRFVLDFGDGTVPVQVFHFAEENGVSWAYFIEPGESARVVDAAKGSRLAVPVYRVPRDILRFATASLATGEAIEWEAACANYRRLRDEGATVVPECLRAPEVLIVPGQLMPHELSRQLRASLLSSERPEGDNVFTLDEEEGLKPFGLFE